MSCAGRGGPAGPGRRPEWSNDAWRHGLDSGTNGRLPLGPGLVFRPAAAATSPRAAPPSAVAARHVAFARVHSGGDERILIATDSGEPRIGAPTPVRHGRCAQARRHTVGRGAAPGDRRVTRIPARDRHP
ncbi:hypothetical protein [Streptomyces sp. NPDC018833]|uniref:hypothetical protein n=1 Tax=Streptomyces sp. NPDC018833 TaxID=3365053 RepID=UPI00378A7E48